MGRWSRELAPKFVAWLASPVQQDWLEVGCGTGSLTHAICSYADPRSLTACDPSAAFVEYARAGFRQPHVTFAVASADDFPIRPDGYDAITSLLALNFFPSAARALERMCSAIRPHGVVSACVWDYAGEMQLLRFFWDAAKKFDTTGRQVDEGGRFPMCDPVLLRQLFESAGLKSVEREALDIVATFRSFSDYWTSFLGGTGPAPAFLASLRQSQREDLKADLQRSVPADSTGAISMLARAWAVRGRSAAGQQMFISRSALLTVVHLIGLALAMGAATAKLVLVFKCQTDHTLVNVHIRIAKLITRQIMLGMALLILSGVVWLVLGYPFTLLLAVKLLLVTLVIASGAFIDKVEQRVEALAPRPGVPSSPEFVTVLKRYLALEGTATLLFYAITVIWVLR